MGLSESLRALSAHLLNKQLPSVRSPDGHTSKFNSAHPDALGTSQKSPQAFVKLSSTLDGGFSERWALFRRQRVVTSADIHGALRQLFPCLPRFIFFHHVSHCVSSHLSRRQGHASPRGTDWRPPLQQTLLSLCGRRGSLKRLPLLSNQDAGPTRARQGFSPSEGPPVIVTGSSWH